MARYTEEQILAILNDPECRGKYAPFVSEKYGMAPSTVSKWRKKYNIDAVIIPQYVTPKEKWNDPPPNSQPPMILEEEGNYTSKPAHGVLHDILHAFLSAILFISKLLLQIILMPILNPKRFNRAVSRATEFNSGKWRGARTRSRRRKKSLFF